MKEDKIMKLTLAQIKNAEPTVAKLLSVELPIKVSYRLTRMAKAFADEIKYYEDSRIKLFDKYGETLEDGTKKIKSESEQAFFSDLTTILNEEVEFKFDHKIHIDLLDGVKLTPIELSALEPWLDGVEFVDEDAQVASA